MTQKEFEEKLDTYADRLSKAVSDGVKKVEEAFEKGRANLQAENENASGVKGLAGSPKMGAILVTLGIVWLLYTFGVFGHPVFPILLIIVGIYFVIRNR